MKFLRAILNKTKDRIGNTIIRLELGVDEIKIAFKIGDWDGLDTWYGWEKRGYLRKCYTEKRRENNQKEDAEPGV